MLFYNVWFCFLGTPEVGGLTVIQGLEILRGCRGLNVIGGDLVEVSKLRLYNTKKGLLWIHLFSWIPILCGLRKTCIFMDI